MTTTDSLQLIGTIRKDLLNARKEHNTSASDILQSIVAAIDNAGAVPVQEVTNSIGVGSTEASRRELSLQDIQKIIQDEIAELQQAISVVGITNNYTRDLNEKIVVLEKYIKTS